MPVPILATKRFRSGSFVVSLFLFQFPGLLAAQSPDLHAKLEQGSSGGRIVMLKGFGDYFVTGEDGRTQVVKPEGLGVNIVAVVQRVQGNKVWIKANGEGDTAVGWLNEADVIALEDAIPYFTSLISRDAKNWDSYLRRAESEHALNQRDAAIFDYTAAIKLHPDEPFLYVRRGRSYRILKACDKAVADFEAAAHLKQQWAEPYNLEAGVYSDCPDSGFRNQEKAIDLIEHAISLDVQHPTYLTILALAYFRNGQLEKAVTTQRQALDSPHFPPAYREEMTNQLHAYERALAAKQAQH